MWRLFACALVVAGCKKAAEPDKAPEKTPDAARPIAKAAPDAAAAPAASAGLCDQVLPAAVRDRVFPGMRLHETTQPGMPALLCELEGDTAFANVAIACMQMEVLQAQMDFGRQQAEKVTELKVGTRAYTGTIMGEPVINVLDDDARCQITTTGYTGDATEVATALAGALTADLAAAIRKL